MLEYTQLAKLAEEKARADAQLTQLVIEKGTQKARAEAEKDRPEAAEKAVVTEKL
jgi:hypothetical protein